jgi:hypothetical protein
VLQSLASAASRLTESACKIEESPLSAYRGGRIRVIQMRLQKHELVKNGVAFTFVYLASHEGKTEARGKAIKDIIEFKDAILQM